MTDEKELSMYPDDETRISAEPESDVANAIIRQADWACHLVNACGVIGDARRRAHMRAWHLNGDGWLCRELLRIASRLAGRSRLRAWYLARRTRRYLAERNADAEYWGDLVSVYTHAAAVLRNLIPGTRSPDMRRRNELLQLTRMLEVKAHEARQQLPEPGLFDAGITATHTTS